MSDTCVWSLPVFEKWTKNSAWILGLDGLESTWEVFCTYPWAGSMKSIALRLFKKLQGIPLRLSEYAGDWIDGSFQSL